MGRNLSFIAAGIGITGVLTGCGAGTSNTAAPSSATAAPVSAASWMDGFCGSLIGIGGLSTMQVPQVGPGDVAAAKTAMVDVFTRAESAVGSAVEGLSPQHRSRPATRPRQPCSRSSLQASRKSRTLRRSLSPRPTATSSRSWTPARLLLPSAPMEVRSTTR